MTTYPDKYLGYLDKEMTIMGVLCAFSIALAGLATDHLLAASQGSFYGDILHNVDGKICALTGSAMALIAGISFYLQRSLLAWYYGQMALEVSLKPPAEDVDRLLTEADGWGTWLRYQVGCTILSFAFVCYAAAVLVALAGQSPGWVPWALLGALAAIVTVLTVRWYVLSTYWYESRPFHTWLRNAGWLKEKKTAVRVRRTRRFRRAKIAQAE